MKQLHSLKSHLVLYLYDENLFVWSITKKELYGFEGLSVAIYFYMEEFSSIGIFDYFKSVSKTKSFIKLIEQISFILNDELSSTLEINQDINIFQKRLSKKVIFSKSVYLKLNENSFLLNIENDFLSKLILPSLQHLEINFSSNSNIDFIINIVEVSDSLYDIYVDGIKTDEIKNKAHILPTLYDRIRICHYQKHNFLLALHSASLSYKDNVLILPGVSGSGKSTFSAYLNYQDFKLFSDELTILDRDCKITPLPLGLTIKKGSWSVVDKFVDKFDDLEKHLRYDGQEIKFITPLSIEYKKFLPKKVFFVFPTFKEGSDTSLKPISIVSALEFFITTGYHIIDSKDLVNITRWLMILSKSKLYTLIYSDIKEAHIVLKKVINK